MSKLTHYLVYRHGSNAANQGVCDRAPVAIVEAASAEEACRIETVERPTAYDSAWLAADPSVTVWANQRLTAVPRSRANASDWNAVLEWDQQYEVVP